MPVDPRNASYLVAKQRRTGERAHEWLVLPSLDASGTCRGPCENSRREVRLPTFNQRVEHAQIPPPTPKRLGCEGCAPRPTT